MSLSAEELRFVTFLRKLADNYDQRAETTWRGFFGHDRAIANFCRKLALAVEDGKHR